jgi:hypothetical protein
MRKYVLVAVAMALVAALPAAGAQAKTKTKQISTGIDLDVAGYIDRHGGVFYFWGGDLNAKRSACRDGRNVTLFRVQPNGTATPVGSNTTFSSSGDPYSSFGDLLEGPPDAITGSYYAEVAPKRVKTTNQKEPKKGVTVVVPFKRAKKVTLNCLGARTPTIYVQVPAGLLTSP